jgi:predicted transcriptional regulator
MEKIKPDEVKKVLVEYVKLHPGLSIREVTRPFLKMRSEATLRRYVYQIEYEGLVELNTQLSSKAILVFPVKREAR